MQHRPWKTTRFQTTTLIAVVVLLVIFFVSVAFFFVLPDLEAEQQREQVIAAVATNRLKWQESSPASYYYVVERSCFCAEEYRRPYAVAIDSGEVRAAFVDDRYREAPPDVVRIEKLFAIAEQTAVAPNRVEVRFEPRFGYPVRVEIDDGTGTPAGTESYVIRDFEVISYD